MTTMTENTLRVIDEATDAALHRPMSIAELTFHVTILREVCRMQQDQISDMSDDIETIRQSLITVTKSMLAYVNPDAQ